MQFPDKSEKSPFDQWLLLLARKQAEHGNAIIAMLRAKQERPDLYAIAVLGERPATTQMDLFTDEAGQ